MATSRATAAKAHDHGRHLDHRSEARDPHHSGLSEARDHVPRHHHAARRCARLPPRGRRAGAALARARRSTRSPGIEARGFILGGAVAHQLSAGFVPIRKKGKLPHETVRIAYSLEYGVDEMEMHADAVGQGRARHPGRRPDRHRRHGDARRCSCCARSAPRSSPPASSSTCRTSAARKKICATWACRCSTLVSFEGH